MSDLPKYLPLSQRPRRDESGVSNDWSSYLRTALDRLASLLEGLDEAAWTGASSRPAHSVAGVANEALVRLERDRRQRLRARLLREPDPGLARAAVIAHLRALELPRRAGIGELAAPVVAAFDIAAATGRPIIVDPIASGAVALARSLSAPLPVRSVVRELTLVASDAEWQVGAGARVPATASAIVLFLYGRGPVPTQPLGG